MLSSAADRISYPSNGYGGGHDLAGVRRHRRDLHRHRGDRRRWRSPVRDEDAVHADRSQHRARRRDRKDSGTIGTARARRGHGDPRHDNGHERRGGTRVRGHWTHRHQGLPAHLGDCPTIGARRLRQLLLLGEAPTSRPASFDRGSRRPHGLPRSRDRTSRRGERAFGGGAPHETRRRPDRRLPPSLVRERRS